MGTFKPVLVIVLNGLMTGFTKQPVPALHIHTLAHNDFFFWLQDFVTPHNNKYIFTRL